MRVPIRSKSMISRKRSFDCRKPEKAIATNRSSTWLETGWPVVATSFAIPKSAYLDHLLARKVTALVAVAAHGPSSVRYDECARSGAARSKREDWLSL
jgi:hypothetical protein